MNENPETTLARLGRARSPVIVVYTHEETSVLESIKRVAGTKRAVSPWSFTSGLKNMPSTDPELTADPAAALDIIANFDEDNSEPPCLFVMKDLRNMMSDVKVIRYGQDVAAPFEERAHTIFSMFHHPFPMIHSLFSAFPPLSGVCGPKSGPSTKRCSTNTRAYKDGQFSPLTLEHKFCIMRVCDPYSIGMGSSSVVCLILRYCLLATIYSSLVPPHCLPVSPRAFPFVAPMYHSNLIRIRTRGLPGRDTCPVCLFNLKSRRCR